MRLEDLIKPLRDRSDEELQEMIRVARHNRDTLKPATVQREKKATERKSVNDLTKLSAKVDALPQEELRKLMAALQADLSGSKS